MQHNNSNNITTQQHPPQSNIYNTPTSQHSNIHNTATSILQHLQHSNINIATLATFGRLRFPDISDDNKTNNTDNFIIYSLYYYFSSHCHSTIILICIFNTHNIEVSSNYLFFQNFFNIFYFLFLLLFYRLHDIIHL